MCKECSNAIELFHKSIEANTRYLNMLYDEACDEKRKRQVSIAGDIDEMAYASNSTSLKIAPQTRNLVRITTAIFQLSSAGTVTIGGRTWNLAAGIYQWGGLHWLLAADDIRQITQTAAGLLSMELMGKSMADTTGVW
jgi:hypothetical protein